MLTTPIQSLFSSIHSVIFHLRFHPQLVAHKPSLTSAPFRSVHALFRQYSRLHVITTHFTAEKTAQRRIVLQFVTISPFISSTLNIVVFFTQCNIFFCINFHPTLKRTLKKSCRPHIRTATLFIFIFNSCLHPLPIADQPAKAKRMKSAAPSPSYVI